MKSSIPADIPTVLEQVRALGSFVGWDGKTVLTIDESKTHCAPGNAVQAKGRLCGRGGSIDLVSARHCRS
jgi:hypothetical protein